MIQALEHRILSVLKEHYIKDCHIFVACSGGSDSMALLECVYSLRSVLKLDVSVIHVFHGLSEDKDKNEYRNKAYEFVKSQCELRKIPFLSNNQTFNEKETEASLRDFRYKVFSFFMKEKADNKPSWLFLAHHSQDLLETRLIRLIRGTAMYGLQGMQINQKPFFRPLLHESKKDLSAYLKQKKTDFIEDPSNENLEPLRNWLRKSWLPLLEEKRSGSLKSLSRSLESICAEKTKLNFESVLDGNSLKTPEFLSLSSSQRQSCLAYYIRHQGCYQYSQSQLLELLKRLEAPQKKKAFHLLNGFWEACEKKISLNFLK